MAEPVTTSPGLIDAETADRFWAKVRKTGDLFSCWEWDGAANERGYGRFKIGGRFYSPHRIAFELENRPLNPGEWVLHHCDNPRCVRPGHLFAGDRAENMRDCVRKGRLSPASPAAFRRGNRWREEWC